MSNLTTYGATRAMNGQSTVTGSMYLGLGTGQSASGLTGELSGGGYARATAGAMNKTANVAANATQITFAGFVNNLGTATHWGLFDAASGGNCVWVGALQNSVNVQAGGQVIVNSGDLVMRHETAT